jgi:hypothetical protein
MSHQDTKTRRKDMGFVPLTEKEEGNILPRKDTEYHW